MQGSSTASASQPNNPSLSAKAVEDRRNAILRALFRIMDEVKVKAVLGNNVTDEYLKHKMTSSHLRSCRSTVTVNYSQTPEAFSSPDVILPTFYNVSKATKAKHILGALSGYAPRKEFFSPNYPAVYLIDPDAMSGTMGSNKLLKLNHETLNNLCRNQKLQFKMLNGQPIVAAMSMFHGLGFVHGCLSGIYNGGPSIVIQALDFMANPMVWLDVITRFKGRLIRRSRWSCTASVRTVAHHILHDLSPLAQDVALTYPLLDQLLSRLDGTNGTSLPLGSVSLESVKNFMICGHGRVQREKSMTAVARLGPLKLDPSAINLIYSHPLAPMATTQAERVVGTVRIYISSKSLRYGLITATTEGDDPTGIWLEDSGVTTVCTSIAIVHPETLEVCAANQVGEIWVCSDSSVNSFHTPAGYPVNPTHPQPFNACITGYDPRVRYVRTGDLGFLWNGQQQQILQRHQSVAGRSQWTQNSAGSGSFQLFVLGRIDESFQIHGLLHFSADVEATVEGSHANVANQGW
jgi:acyl-CoA synthetase (AMP-forming)/AMP-acid ligase II